MHYEAANEWQRAIAALRDAARHAKHRNALAEGDELLARALRLAENLRQPARAEVNVELQGDLADLREAAVVAANS
jgi:hypothetical protein